MKHFIFWAVTSVCTIAIGVAYLALGNYLFALEYSAQTSFERFTFFGALYLIAFCASNGIGMMLSLAFKKKMRRDDNPGETAMAVSIINVIILFVGLAFMGTMALEMTEESIIAGTGAMMLSNILAIRFSFEGGKQLAPA